MAPKERLAIGDDDTDTYWELEGESALHALLIPDPPQAGKACTVRLTLSNVYEPLDGITCWVRVGNPDAPTDADDLDSHEDWLQAGLVEELVLVGDREIPRSRAKRKFDEETPWWATYEASLTLEAGSQLLEIRLLSKNPRLFPPIVLSDWEVQASR